MNHPTLAALLADLRDRARRGENTEVEIDALIWDYRANLPGVATFKVTILKGPMPYDHRQAPLAVMKGEY